MKAIRQRKPSIFSAYIYRIPVQVRKMRQLLNGDCYPICPRCSRTLDREYMHFCDRCGQRLAWEMYEFATVVSSPSLQKTETPEEKCQVGK